ncbi:hypothetical protein [Oceanobacillus sp. CF4.6]|uniref:hypothetical protein n=1 Tax=Oceanobacillus sp. CF4.6 TaxID=3373080 RepID=UPI003EE4562F
MHRYKLYNSDDVEKLQRELDIYKYTLETVKSRDGVNGYLKTKSDFNDLQLKYSKLKGEMKIMEENHQRSVTEYELEKQFLSTRMNTVSESISQMEQDMNWIMDRMEQMRFTELLEKMNQVMSKQDDHLIETKIKIERLNEEILQFKKYMGSNVPTPEPAKEPLAPKKSEYRQLQNMLQSPNYVEQAGTKKKNNMTNTQISRRPMLNNQTPYPTNTSGSVQNTTSMNQGKKTFRNSQYELNKNTVTRITTKKSNQGKKKAKSNVDENPLMTANDNTPPLTNDNTSMEKNVEETKVPDVNIEKHSETNIELPNKQEEEFKTFTRYLSKEATDNQIVAAEKEEQSDGQDIDNDQESQLGKKMEFSSLFSIFRKS